MFHRPLNWLFRFTTGVKHDPQSNKVLFTNHFFYLHTSLHSFARQFIWNTAAVDSSSAVVVAAVALAADKRTSWGKENNENVENEALSRSETHRVMSHVKVVRPTRWRRPGAVVAAKLMSTPVVHLLIVEAVHLLRMVGHLVGVRVRVHHAQRRRLLLVVVAHSWRCRLEHWWIKLLIQTVFDRMWHRRKRLNHRVLKGNKVNITASLILIPTHFS